MTERQLQFRVGLFVVMAALATAAMILQFGELKTFFEEHYVVAIHFDEAPGVYPSTPVSMNSIGIGSVRAVKFDQQQGGVLVLVNIREHYRIRKDAQPRLVRTLLGDSSIDFSPGSSREFLRAGAHIEGIPAVDPMEIVNRLESKVSTTLEVFNETSGEWTRVARNLNNLMETNHGTMDAIIERTAEALHEFTLTMRTANQTLTNANRVFGDPENQENLKKALATLPELTKETRATIVAIRHAVSKMDENLTNLSDVTGPLAEHSLPIVLKLDNTLSNMERFSGELADFSHLIANGNGSVKEFATNPDLYRNLNRSASSLSLLLKNLEPIVRDLRTFSDKVARHPELIGVGGALKGSSGLKDLPEELPRRPSTRPRGLLRR